MIKSRICDLINIKYPIFQGGMAWVSEACLASAVSNAGGLGIISAMNADAEYLRKEIRKCKEMTNNPFGVNIMLMSPFVDEVAQVIIDEGIKVVTTGAGIPGKYMPQWLNAGIKVIPVISSTLLAQKLEKMGASAVIAEGCESGGHISEACSLPLIPQICDSVSIPVIAAGGIADGRGLAAALMLGAEGVQCGTCFLVAEECQIHPNYKNNILKATDSSTIITGKRLGHPVRALKSKFTRQFAAMETDESISSDSILQFGSGALRKASQEGNETEGSFMAGQVAGMVKEIQPAKIIIENMVCQAEQLLKYSSTKIK